MGWLRESMSQAGVKSFGELARMALAHPEWPEDSRAQPRSLEAILGRLDKREDLDWLADRPGIQQILAELLKLSVSEIRTLLLDSQGARTTVTRLRLDDLRVARGFDLTQEPLPPTIPERVSLPATWTRCCWIDSAGAGFTLAGQWLAARGLAQCASLETLEEARGLPLAGPPLYLELRAELLDAFARDWRGTQPLCIASSCHADPRPSAGLLPPNFELLRSAPIVPCLEQLVDWVLFRLSGRPQSQRSALLSWLNDGPCRWGLVQTLGDALGLVGAFVEGSVDPSQATTKDALLSQWMAHRTSELARDRHRDLASLRQTLPEVLVDMAQSVLIDAPRSLLAPRTVDEWLALVPEHHRRGPDIDWLTTRLVSDNLPMRKPDLERAVQRLPPGAHRIIVALRELSVIRPTSATGFAIRPHFLGRLADAVARDRLVASAPVIWGEGLLRPSARASLLPILQERAKRQPESLTEDVLEHVDMESAALVCAFETSFVLLGLAVLSGAELSDQLAAALLEEQAALMLNDIGELPTTRMFPSEPSGVADLPGTFFLAAWTLSEHSRVQNTVLPAALDPWHCAELPTVWPSLLDRVADCVRAALSDNCAWFAGAVRLLDRIRHFIGNATGLDQRPHALFLVGSVIDAIELGVLEWPDVESVLSSPWQWEFLVASLRTRGTTAETLTHAFFSAWTEAGSTPSGYQLFDRWPRAWFRSAPPRLLAQLLLTSQNEPWQIDDDCELPPSAWQAWLDARRGIALEHEPIRPWQLAPALVVEQVLVSHPPTSDPIRRLIWTRHEQLALRHVERNRTLQPQTAADWLRVAPVEVAPTIAQFGMRSGWLRAADTLVLAFQRLLHEAVSRRVDHWRIAYDCLSQAATERRRFDSPR